MDLQREAKHMEEEDAKSCGRKRKAAFDNLGWHGHDHHVQWKV